MIEKIEGKLSDNFLSDDGSFMPWFPCMVTLEAYQGASNIVLMLIMPSELC